MRFKGCFIVLALSVLAFSWVAQTTLVPVSPKELPDLIVEDIIWFPEEPHVAEDLSLQVIIKNIGDAPITKKFRWELHIGKKKDPIRWTFDAKEPMLPGDSWIGIFDIDKEARRRGWGLSEGDHKLRAVVDPDHWVVESNEENNELVKTIHVGPKLTTYATTTITSATTKVRGTTTMAVISDVDYPRNVEPGEEFEIKVTVQYSSPYDIRVRLWDLDLERPIDEVTDKIGPYMGVKTYTFTLTAPTEVTTWKLSVDVSYILPYYIDQSRVYKRTEPGWYYDFEVYVGAETETTAMTTTVSETSAYPYETETETSISATAAETSVMSSLTTATTPLTVGGGGGGLSTYAPYVLGGIAVVAAAVAFLALKMRKPKPPSVPATMKHCINCGIELPLDAEYCHECGAKQPSAEEVE